MDKEFITWLEDVFSAVPDTSVRKMFGGVGFVSTRINVRIGVVGWAYCA